MIDDVLHLSEKFLTNSFFSLKKLWMRDISQDFHGYKNDLLSFNKFLMNFGEIYLAL